MKRTVLFAIMIVSAIVGTEMDVCGCGVAPIACMDFSNYHFDTGTGVYCTSLSEMLGMNASSRGDYTGPCADGFQPGIRSYDDDTPSTYRLPVWQDGVKRWYWDFGDGEDYYEGTWFTGWDRGGSDESGGGEGTSGCESNVNGCHWYSYSSTANWYFTATLVVEDDDEYEGLAAADQQGGETYDILAYDLDIDADYDCIGVGQLIPVSLSLSPSGCPVGYCLLEALHSYGYTDTVKVWADENRQTLLIPYTDPQIGDDWSYGWPTPLVGVGQDLTVWVEATSAGAVGLNLKFMINACEEVGDESLTFDVENRSVSLTAVAVGNDPDLDPGLICLNAQEDYEKAKWKANVTGGGTASVSSVGAVGVSFEGVGGSNPAALEDGDEFWVTDATGSGEYTIRITHNDCHVPYAEESGTAFRFVVAVGSPSAAGGTVGNGAWGSDFVQAFCNTEGSQHAATVEVRRYAWIETEPSGQYGEYVRCQLRVSERFQSGDDEYGLQVYNTAEYWVRAIANLNIDLSWGLIDVGLSLPYDVQEMALFKGEIRIKGPEDDDFQVSPTAQRSVSTDDIFVVGDWDATIDIDEPCTQATHVNCYRVGDSSSRAEAYSKASVSGARQSWGPAVALGDDGPDRHGSASHIILTELVEIDEVPSYGFQIADPSSP